MRRGSWSVGVVVVMVAGVAGSARAEVYASGQLTLVRETTHSSLSSTELGPGFQGEVGVRFGRKAAVALHLGIARARYDEENPHHSGTDSWRASYMPLDLGLGVQVAVDRRVTLGLWAGFQDEVGVDACTFIVPLHVVTPPEATCSKSTYRAIRQPEVGVMVAVDLFERRRHRTSIFASVSHGIATGIDDHVSITSDSAAIGIGYRYW